MRPLRAGLSLPAERYNSGATGPDPNTYDPARLFLKWFACAHVANEDGVMMI